MKILNQNDYFSIRYELIKDILIKNGEKDEKYLSREFWEENVDYKKMVQFIDSVVEKDASKKKQIILRNSMLIDLSQL